MRYGTSISLRDEDIEKLEYIREKNNFHSSTPGLSGIVRFCIQKAYAHQIEFETKMEEKEKNKINEESCILPIGGMSQGQTSKDERKRKW